VRKKVVAFAEAKSDKGDKGDKGDKADAEAKPADEATKPDDKKADDKKAEGKKPEKSESKADAKSEPGAEAKPDPKAEPKPEPKAEAKANPKPEPEPEPEPDEEPVRARTSTASMTAQSVVGAPPEVPAAAAPATADVPVMPGPREIPSGNPDDAAPPPGRVPAGDSRSLRNGDQFALVYRQGTFVITRIGTVGKRGQWRVVEYPTPAAASNFYARESSRFVSEGFSDYRE
jgi:ribonuclease E